MKPGEKTKKLTQTLSIILGVVFFVFIIVILLVLIVPELTASISGFISDFPQNFAAFQLWLNKKIENNPNLVSAISSALSTIMDYLEGFFENSIMPKMDKFIGQFTNIILGTLNIIKNFIIGIIVTVYALSSKETFKAQSKKIIYAVLKPDYADIFLDTVRHSHRIFIGFISGKILDSLIIGIICFIGLSILKMPYSLLVSVIVGVTNIIPFFGPYIGAIPSAILILIVSPVQGLHFIIFIIILQQFDGNILGPKILGDSTGLPAFWVLFSILLGGGLLGIFGMIIGVPTFAVIYYIIKTIVENMLYKKELPTETEKYTNIQDFSSISKKN